MEVLAPVRDPALRARLDEILELLLSDDTPAWELAADGSWRPPRGGHVTTCRPSSRKPRSPARGESPRSSWSPRPTEPGSRGSGARFCEARERVHERTQLTAALREAVLDVGRPGVDHRPLEHAGLLEVGSAAARRVAGGMRAERLQELVETDGALVRDVEDRDRPASLEEVRRAADLLWERRRSYDSACAECGSSDSSSTSSRLITGWKLISLRTSSGMSSRSARFRSGMITSVRPAAWAARAFCLQAADRQHPTLQRDLAGHADSVLHRPAREQRGERGRHRDPGARDRPSGSPPRARARGSWRPRSRARRGRASRRASARTRARSAPTPSSRRRAGRSGRVRPCPGILVASTNSTSPPVPVTARPVATPGTAVRSADSW